MTRGAGGSRVVVRTVEPGSSVLCTFCGSAIKFSARTKPRQVIANVYENGTWSRVEHYHAECYEEAGEPYGPVASAERA